MRRDFLALLASDPFASLLGELPEQRPEPRTGDDGDPQERGDHGERRVGEDASHREKRGEPREQQEDTEGEARDVSAADHHGLGALRQASDRATPALSLHLVAARPEHGRPEREQHDREHQSIAEPQTEPPQEQQDAEHDQPDGDGLSQGGPSRGHRARGIGRHQVQEHVERQPEPGREREHYEAEPDHQ